MRRLLVTLDDDLDLCLAKYPNQAEIVRNAVRLYHGDITPDTIDGMRAAFAQLTKQIKELEETLNFQYSLVERNNKILEEFKNR
jgi:hypothetical protein